MLQQRIEKRSLGHSTQPFDKHCENIHRSNHHVRTARGAAIRIFIHMVSPFSRPYFPQQSLVYAYINISSVNNMLHRNSVQ